MTMNQETNRTDCHARAHGPPGAGPGYGFQRSRRSSGFRGANVPSLQRQERQKQNRAPPKVTEAGRWLVASRLAIQPRDDGPGAQQQTDDQQTQLRTFHPQYVRGKLLEQLILPQEIPFRFDTRKSWRKRVGFFAQFPVHARTVRDKYRQDEQDHEADQPQKQVTQGEAGEEPDTPRRDLGAKGRGHSLALNEQEMNADEPHKRQRQDDNVQREEAVQRIGGHVRATP